MTIAADPRLESALRGRPRRKDKLYYLICSVCNGSFTSRRGDAQTCSPRCRKARQREEEALSQISLTKDTGVAETVSDAVTGADTTLKISTPESREIDRLERDRLSWHLTLADSRCHYPGCQTPRKGIVLRPRRLSGPMFCQYHFGEALPG